MNQANFPISGPKIATDFRDNLIIDRYDPVFATLRARKCKHLRSSNSEDVVTWNIFRSLRQIDPSVWLPALSSAAFPGGGPTGHERDATVTLWKNVPPPPSLLSYGDEGESEIDIIIESPSWVWFIEAKLTSDISTKTTMRDEREYATRALEWLTSLEHLKSGAPADSSVTSVYAVIMQVARTLQATLGSAPIPLEVLKKEVMAVSGCAEGSVLPSDYAYNRINRAKWSGEKPIFLAEGRGKYRYVGPDAHVDCDIVWAERGQADRVVGHWKAGVQHLIEDPRTTKAEA